MDAPRLTDQQIAFFETFGYLGFPGLLADCIGEIIDAFEAVWARRGGGHDGRPHEGTARSCIVQFLDQQERLCALLEPGEEVVLMGPTGTPTEIPEGETVLLAGGGLGNAVLFSIAAATACGVLFGAFPAAQASSVSGQQLVIQRERVVRAFAIRRRHLAQREILAEARGGTTFPCAD